MGEIRELSDINLEVSLGPIRLKNPVMLASGTCGYGRELTSHLDLNSIGAVVVKGISLEPRPGNPPPRIFETPCGLLNAIGLENVGVRAFLKEKLPWLKDQGISTVVNILGNSVEEYKRLCSILSEESQSILAIEINVSCPNVKAGGVAFGRTPEGTYEVVRHVVEVTEIPIIVKLSPNVTDITSIAQAAQDAGAHAISLINTILAMAIDIEKKRPLLGNTFGGLSGPAIKPIALRMVWEAHRAVDIPVIGIGGISTWKDAVEFLMAGASAIQIGTATLVEPGSAKKILDGLTRFMRQKGYREVEALWID